jgi:dienelactone hydrolase
MLTPSRRGIIPVAASALALLLSACGTSLHLVESDHATVLARHVVEGPSPSTPGSWEVGYLTYGSGTDRRRPEYADSAAFTTSSVDASKLVNLGGEAASRKRYWGFGPDAFPRNGRVWYPVGEGPFPLVLVVHGNHNPRNFSDPGYAYLGELLASRGFILVSVDMNFLNGSIRGENDARGWMLLQHLKAWREFDADEANPFHGRVDWDRIALMGHSRGGEAVAHAAAFNRLAFYPDDASLAFDFGFGIRSLVAIAPVDGQYEPSSRPVPLEDVNYLVFHGSHDGDVTSFAGLRQYARVGFSGHVPAFKSAVYVYRANHGQWNEEWGARDRGPRSPRLLALDGLLPMEDQLEFARVYVTAFLEATLKGDATYLPLFRDHRTAGGWLPPTMYKTHFQHSSFRPLADFGEDIDLTTGTEPGVTLRGEGLSTWREGEMVLRARVTPQRQVSQQRQGVWLGWHRTDEVEAPRYRITLPDHLAGAWGVEAGATLELEVAPTERRPPPPPAPDPVGADTPANPANPAHPAEPGPGSEGDAARTDDAAGEDEPIDLSVELIDAGGARASLPLGAFGPLRPPLDIRVLRRSDLEASRFPTLYEVVGHGFSLPLDEFVRVNPALDLARLREIHLVFDLARVGEIIVSGVGLAWPGEAFLSPRLDPPVTTP